MSNALEAQRSSQSRTHQTNIMKRKAARPVEQSDSSVLYDFDFFRFCKHSRLESVNATDRERLQLLMKAYAIGKQYETNIQQQHADSVVSLDCLSTSMEGFVLTFKISSDDGQHALEKQFIITL
ncbi:MAG: hypothetical protein ACRC5C_05350 [Bacilli bacterium]